jgi:AcrR family transcriptional regulator
MPSSKSTAPRAPQRRRGELRVAALLEAAVAVFAEKGFEAATMTEIAARAGAPIGSLYQFFPNKEVLGDALIDRYAAQLDRALADIEARAASLTTAHLADALLDLFPSHRQERDAALALIDARPDRNHRGVALRDELRRRLAALFAIRAPHRTAQELAGVTVAFLSSMKAIATVSAEAGRPEAALDEVKTMARLYLVERLGG